MGEMGINEEIFKINSSCPRTSNSPQLGVQFQIRSDILHRYLSVSTHPFTRHHLKVSSRSHPGLALVPALIDLLMLLTSTQSPRS